MSKLSLILLLVAVLAIASTQADGDRRPCPGRCQSLSSGGKSVCIRNKATNTCTKLRACRLREKNCRRRDSGLEPIRETCVTRCRNILGSSGVGQCAPRLRKGVLNAAGSKRLRNCRKPCQDSKIATCWRNKQNGCILQTRCQAEQRNCERPNNQWMRASQWSCKGNVVGGGVRHCNGRSIIKD
ncbi:uncharacterized protein [Drosophila kikkawai]|uniref:Uncharacterized protein n=1 Tax=Drosophila kikkawai TaxID=30033 RepID=A0A6P4IMT0_DROKI|nr:uncharacterized protein LOC108075984 [Drosophila kikkawai]